MYLYSYLLSHQEKEHFKNVFYLVVDLSETTKHSELSTDHKEHRYTSIMFPKPGMFDVLPTYIRPNRTR